MAKIIYELKRYHHRKAYRRGDLEDEDVQDFSQNFNTRKDANAYLEKKCAEAERKGWTTHLTLVKRGDKPSTLWVYTGETWVNENSGEDQEESFAYQVKKVTL